MVTAGNSMSCTATEVMAVAMGLAAASERERLTSTPRYPAAVATTTTQDRRSKGEFPSDMYLFYVGMAD